MARSPRRRGGGGAAPGEGRARKQRSRGQRPETPGSPAAPSTPRTLGTERASLCLQHTPQQHAHTAGGGQTTSDQTTQSDGAGHGCHLSGHGGQMFSIHCVCLCTVLF